MPSSKPRPVVSMSSAPATVRRRTFTANSNYSNDAGVRRRARKRAQDRSKNVLVWSVFLVLSVLISGASLGVWSRFQGVKEKVALKQATLHDLQAQLDTRKRKLATMTSPAGKDRVLVENGFVRPDQRILLFPSEKKARE